MQGDGPDGSVTARAAHRQQLLSAYPHCVFRTGTFSAAIKDYTEGSNEQVSEETAVSHRQGRRRTSEQQKLQDNKD